MKTLSYLAALGMLAIAPVAAQAADSAAAAVRGKMLYAAGGTRLGSVYRVTADGSAQVIIDGKLVTVPASSITVADGKLLTTMTKNDVISMH